MINYNGLSDEEVIINRKKFGTNELTKVKQKTFFKLLLEYRITIEQEIVKA